MRIAGGIFLWSPTVPCLVIAAFGSSRNATNMQSLLASLYPLFKANYDLDFVQIGLLTMLELLVRSLREDRKSVV